jgi:hypothetical protein
MCSVSIIPCHPSIVSCSADECPIGSRWHADWRAYTLDRLKTPEWFYRFDGLERPLVGTPTLDWTVGPGDRQLFPGKRTPPLAHATHRHAAFTVSGHVVHIDLVKGHGGTPGFGLNALLMHVDGEFRGSAWTYGSMGGSGNSFPAVARVNDGLALVGDYPPMGYLGMPYVLVRRASPPRRAEEAGAEASRPDSLTVEMGTLTRLEFDALRSEHQDFVEAPTRELLARYGEGFFERNNDRLREELNIRRFGVKIHPPDRYPEVWRVGRRRSP